MKDLCNYDLDVINLMKKYPVNEDSGYLYIRSSDNQSFVDNNMNEHLMIHSMLLMIQEQPHLINVFLSVALNYIDEIGNKEHKEFVISEIKEALNNMMLQPK